MTGIVDECAAIALAELAEDTARRFIDDPLGALRDDLNLTVRAVDHLEGSRTDGGVCDGVSYLSDGVVLYRRTGNRRENFTLAHELGHWLVDRSDAIYDRLAAENDPAKLLESICDQVARRLLLPDQRITTILNSTSVEARHVLDLYSSSSASLHACVVALKDSLPGLGALLVIEPGGESVRYASVRPHDQLGWPTVYPWPGQSVPSGHPLRNIRPGGTVRQRTFWRMPWGTSAEFYMDAVADPHRTVAILSAEDLWEAEKFHPAVTREYAQRPDLETRCCGQARTVRGWPCDSCGQPYCPACGMCTCQRQSAAEALCSACFMSYLPHLLVNGLCEDCR